MARNTRPLRTQWERDCRIPVSNFVDIIPVFCQPTYVCSSAECHRSTLDKIAIFSPVFLTVFRKDCSPGPGYFIEASVTRNGKDGTPIYSILGRQKDPSEYFLRSLALKLLFFPRAFPKIPLTEPFLFHNVHNTVMLVADKMTYSSIIHYFEVFWVMHSQQVTIFLETEKKFF